MTSYSYEKSFWETIWEFLPGILKFLSVIALISSLFTLFVSLNNRVTTNPGGPLSVTEAIRSYNSKVGPTDSKVKILYFLDYQCPACKSNNANMTELKKTYADRIEFIYKHFPLKSIHANALNAARATQAAGRQNKFFEYGDLLYTNQDNGLGTDNLANYANQVGLDADKWNQDRNSSQVWNEVDADLADITNLALPKSSVTGVTKTSGNLNDMGTPTIIIVKDGQVYDWWSSVLPLDEFKAKLDEALK